MAKKIIIGGSTEVVVPEKSDISQQIKDEAQLESLVFNNQEELEEWILDGSTEHEGYLPSDLKIGQNLYTIPDDEPDFWVVSTPVTSMSNLKIIGSEIEGVIPSLPYAEKVVPENDDELYLYDGSTKKLNIGNLLYKKLYGKKITTLGDSIVAASYSWAYKLAEKYSMDLQNLAVSGATIINDIDSRPTIYNQFDDIDEDTNFILISGGINDRASAPVFVNAMGRLTDDYGNSFDTSTFYGALEYYFMNAKELYPNAKIGFIIPHRIGNSFPFGRQGGENGFQEYRKAIIETCNKWNIPYLDINNISPLNFAIEWMKDEYSISQDGVHPTSEAYELFYMPYLEEWLLNDMNSLSITDFRNNLGNFSYVYNTAQNSERWHKVATYTFPDGNLSANMTLLVSYGDLSQMERTVILKFGAFKGNGGSGQALQSPFIKVLLAHSDINVNDYAINMLSDNYTMELWIKTQAQYDCFSVKELSTSNNLGGSVYIPLLNSITGYSAIQNTGNVLYASRYENYDKHIYGRNIFIPNKRSETINSVTVTYDPINDEYTINGTASGNIIIPSNALTTTTALTYQINVIGTTSYRLYSISGGFFLTDWGAKSYTSGTTPHRLGLYLGGSATVFNNLKIKISVVQDTVAQPYHMPLPSYNPLKDSGSTSSRPTYPIDYQQYFNTDLKKMQVYNGVEWETLNGLSSPITITTNKTLELTDAGKILMTDITSDITITIPPNSSVAFPLGTIISFSLLNAYKITFAGGSGVTLNSADNAVELSTQYAMASLIKYAENTWLLVGALE